MKSFKILYSILTLAAASFLQAGEGWINDFEMAKKTAKEEDKTILIDFTGSDWCGWCIKLDKEVFSKPAFKDYASSNLVLMEADFPQNKPISDEVKAQNEALAEKYGIRGFPTIILVSPDGKLIGKTGYKQGGAEKYVEHLKELIGNKPKADS